MAATPSVTREILVRRLSGEARVRLACELTDLGFALMRAGIVHRHPAWGPAAIEREVRKRLGYRVDVYQLYRLRRHRKVDADRAARLLQVAEERLAGPQS